MNKHLKAFWQGRGFYLALALVVAGAALASFLAISSMMRAPGAKSASDVRSREETTWDIGPQAEVENKQKDVPVPSSSSLAQQSTASSAGLSSASSSVPQEPTGLQPAQAPSFRLPVAGRISQGFSGSELVFNDTMKDWRTHNGMDIAGGLNIGVHAPADAAVTNVYEDPQWGGVIVLQSGALEIRLCGVKEAHVAQGDTVRAGDTLAALGEIPAEASGDVHLHVEFLENGNFVDPAKYFA